MKELYDFTVNKKKEVEVKEDTPNGVLVRKEFQNVPVKIILKKPNRLEVEEADLFYAKEWSNLVKAGVLTKDMLAKQYADSGGYRSKDDSDYYLELMEEYARLTTERTYLELKEDEESKAKKEENNKRLTEIFIEIQSFENRESQLLNNTAEVKARDKTIQWLVLNLTYIQEDEVSPYFKGNTYEKKMDFCYEMYDSEDEFFTKVFEKASLFISFWYMSRNRSREDFEFIEKQLEDGAKE